MRYVDNSCATMMYTAKGGPVGTALADASTTDSATTSATTPGKGLILQVELSGLTYRVRRTCRAGGCSTMRVLTRDSCLH